MKHKPQSFFFEGILFKYLPIILAVFQGKNIFRWKYLRLISSISNAYYLSEAYEILSQYKHID